MLLTSGILYQNKSILGNKSWNCRVEGKVGESVAGWVGNNVYSSRHACLMKGWRDLFDFRFLFALHPLIWGRPFSINDWSILATFKWACNGSFKLPIFQCILLKLSTFWSFLFDISRILKCLVLWFTSRSNLLFYHVQFVL